MEERVCVHVSTCVCMCVSVGRGEPGVCAPVHTPVRAVACLPECDGWHVFLLLELPIAIPDGDSDQISAPNLTALRLAGKPGLEVSVKVVYSVKRILLCSSMHQSVSSVAQSCPTLCDPMNCSTPGLPVHHQLQESTQTHVHPVGVAIQPSYPLSSPSPPAFHLSHQGLF